MLITYGFLCRITPGVITHKQRITNLERYRFIIVFPEQPVLFSWIQIDRMIKSWRWLQIRCQSNNHIDWHQKCKILIHFHFTVFFFTLFIYYFIFISLYFVHLIPSANCCWTRCNKNLNLSVVLVGFKRVFFSIIFGSLFIWTP